MPHKSDGFYNQVAIVLPEYIQSELQQNPLTKLLYVSDVGFYPKAQHHYRMRPKGCEQNILIYCIEGSGWVETNNVKKRIETGCFFIIPADLPHTYGSDDRTPWSIYWIHFTGIQAPLFCNQALLYNTLHSGENTRNDRRIRLFNEIFQNLSMGYSKENLEYASVCLWYLLGSFSFLPQFERIRTIQQSDIVEKSILYMHNHLNETVTLHDIAAHCGYSDSHFSLIFKKKTTRSPIEYFLDLKMQQACQMLDFTTQPIKAIALELSFDDPFYFSRLFKKYIGISPIDYRKKKKG
jgi:AraC family transcriptional regulator, arabinose operon regulatory protein